MFPYPSPEFSGNLGRSFSSVLFILTANEHILTESWLLFGNHSSQLPRLIEKLPQWAIPGSTRRRIARRLPNRIQIVFGLAAVFYSTIGMG
jgi:hypothetical protein